MADILTHGRSMSPEEFDASLEARRAGVLEARKNRVAHARVVGFLTTYVGLTETNERRILREPEAPSEVLQFAAAFDRIAQQGLAGTLFGIDHAHRVNAEGFAAIHDQVLDLARQARELVEPNH